MTTTGLMSVECRTCPVRELHCDDCMVPVLLSLSDPARRPDTALDPDERAAVTRLVGAGLVAPEEAAQVRARVHQGPVGLPAPGRRAVG